MCCSAVEHLVRRLYCQKCYRCLRTNSIEPIINEINFLIFILLFFGLLDTPQNISPDVLLLNSPWDAKQDALLDALLDSLPETLPYTSPFQTNFEQWYVLPNLAKLLLFFLSLWAVRTTHRSFWCLLNGIIITSSRKKIQFLKFFLPLILMIVLGKHQTHNRSYWWYPLCSTFFSCLKYFKGYAIFLKYSSSFFNL